MSCEGRRKSFISLILTIFRLYYHVSKKPRLYFACISLLLSIFRLLFAYISLILIIMLAFGKKTRLYFAYIIILSQHCWTNLDILSLIFRLYYTYIIILSQHSWTYLDIFSLIFRLYFAYIPLIFANISLIFRLCDINCHSKSAIYHTLFVVPPWVFFLATSRCGTF